MLLSRGEGRPDAGPPASVAAGPASGPLVAIERVSKSFGENRVLDEVDLVLHAGEVHALLGGNGAGKSTLMKILMGVHRADSGRVVYRGRDITGSPVGEHLARGIAMIFQELSLLPNLTVAENVFLLREPRRPGWRVDRRRMAEETRALLDRHGFRLRASDRVRDLGFAQRQLVEIVKAVSRGAEVLIMDEPTSSLTVAEEEALFGIIADLKRRGIAIVYISHRMAEIFRVADRISIVKDGRLIGPLDPGTTTVGRVADLMSSTPTAAEGPAGRARAAAGGREPALAVRGLATARKLDGVTLRVGAGEVVGLAGLVGSGRSTLAKAIFGLLPDARGEILVAGEPLRPGSPRRAIAAGVGFVPEDRRLEGLVLPHALAANVALPSLRRLSVGLGLRAVSRRRTHRLFAEYRERLGIVCRGPGQPADQLSGGNQQKVVFAKWLATGPRLLILDEPTAGVDVNAKREMRRLVRETVAAGVGVLLVSSELDELLALSDRVLIMAGGRLSPTSVEGRGESDLRAALQAESARARQGTEASP